MASVPTGTKLGKYEVVKPLASGGMAELLLAKTASAERPLVLKWIRPEQAIDGTFVETFVTEGRRAAQLHHPNIVEVHEVGREDGTHYLAMEYVHGDDLRKLLARLHERRAKLPVQHILAITTAVAQALQHAHEQLDGGSPVLHLGIKPGNVIITADGAVKLADFGIGRAALTDGRTDLLPTIVGYLSPEQCTGQPLDRRTDIFGLGILMYELAVGRRLFKGDNELVTMATIVAGDIPPPSKHRGDLPKDLEAVIMKALARAPEDRFQSAQELHNALDKFATKAGVRGSLTTLAGYTKRLFGVRPEPWLVDDDPNEVSAPHDFDASPKGLAVPPIEAVQSCSLPSFVVAGEDAPIMRVKKQVSRDLPTEQLNLANLKAAADRGVAPQDKSTPMKIPSASNGNSGPARAVPKPLPNRPTPVPVAPGRNKPKTVQIPVVVADKITKEDSTKVMVQPPPASMVQDELTEEKKTNVLGPAELAFLIGSSEDTKDSERMPAMSSEVRTPTTGVDLDRATTTPLTPKPGEEDTIPALRPPPPAPRPPPAATKPTNGVNGKPAQVSLAGLKDADDKAKRKKGVDLPKPVVGEIRPRLPPPSSSRMGTDVDEVTPVGDSTTVGNPPPMVAATTAARDSTEHVKPLPAHSGRPRSTDNIIEVEGRKKKWVLLAGVAVTALAAIVVVVGFTGGSADPQPSAADVPKGEPAIVADKQEPEETKPSELRTSSVPRTPRNSHVTVDDQKPEEPKVEEPKVEPEIEEPKAAPPPPPDPIPEPPVKKPKVVDPPPPPKFVEPKDPSPPDDEVKPTKPKPAKTKPVPTKPKPTAVAQKPKPKPTPVTKPTPLATKPKPTKPKPTATKPAGKWDPNSLFPK